MRVAEFCEKYPSVFHMTNEANWPSIQKYGLLSAKSLCKDLLELSQEETDQIISSHRPSSQTRHGIIFRDQKPLNESKLQSCLAGSGLTPAQWYTILNERVFFWTKRDRLDRFIAVYKNESRRVLEVDTARLLDRHLAQVELCQINSGATRMPNVFRSRASRHKPAELTVIGEVRDILTLLLR